MNDYDFSFPGLSHGRAYLRERKEEQERQWAVFGNDVARFVVMAGCGVMVGVWEVNGVIGVITRVVNMF